MTPDAQPGLLDLSHREILRVTGPDRRTWLQGVLSNEVEKLAAGAGDYQAVLTAKGRMVSDAWLLCRENELLLDVPRGRGAAVKEHLQRYLISEDAAVEDASAAWKHFALVGEVGDALGIGVPAAEGAFVDAGDLIAQRRWLGLHVFVAPQREADVRARLAGVRALTLDDTEPLRIEAGIARWGMELDEDTIPLEAQLGAALSFLKGCYVGQEVVARGHFQGHMNRLLVRLRVEGPAAAPGAQLLWRGKPPGRVTSVAKGSALGYVWHEAARAGARLDVQGGGAAEVLGPPFGAERLPPPT
jgi:folate-binding protein YgfZ